MAWACTQTSLQNKNRRPFGRLLCVFAEGTGFEGHNGVGTSQGYLWSATTGVAYLYLLSLQPTLKNLTLSAWNANARRVLLLIVSYGCLHTERNTINKKKRPN